MPPSPCKRSWGDGGAIGAQIGLNEHSPPSVFLEGSSSGLGWVRSQRLAVSLLALKLPHQLKVFRQIEVEAKRWQIHDLEAGSSPARPLTMTLE